MNRSWMDVQHFTAEEIGSPGAIKPEIDQNLIRLCTYLDIFRRQLRYHTGRAVKINIHKGYAEPGDSKHARNSKHFLGQAADLHAYYGEDINNVVPLFDQWMVAERCNVFTGVGVYPLWNRQGLHLDIADRHFRWIWFPGEKIYQPMEASSVKRLMNILV